MVSTNDDNASTTAATPSTKHRPKRVTIGKALERWAGYLLIRTVQLLVRVTGAKGAAYWGAVLGTLFFRFCRRYRDVALKNLALVYPEMPAGERRAMAQRVLINFGKSATEFLRIPYMAEAEFTERTRLEGREHLDAALAEGRGVLLVTAHYGNWELLAARLIREGYQLDALARDPELPNTAHLLRSIRESRTLLRVYPKTSIRPVIRALKENRVIGIVADQHDWHGIVVDFLGHPARTPVGPAAMALMTGAQLVPAFSFRREDNTFDFRLYPPIAYTPTGNREDDIFSLTRLVAQSVEVAIRELPEQWLWFHDRWRPECGHYPGEHARNGNTTP